MKSIITPAILYWAAPVVLVTTKNEDKSSNVGPISSAWWLGHRCMIGLDASSQTTKNLLRTKQCVLNLPSDIMMHHINPIARTTGSAQVPEAKAYRGYRHEKNKFQRSGLTPVPSDLIEPDRIDECPVQMEAEMVNSMEMMQDLPDRKGLILAIELKILRTHVEDDIRLVGHANRVDTDRWRPMIMCFSEMYGLKPRRLGASDLAQIPEEKYRPLTKSDVMLQGGDMDAFEVTH